jgi:hypothetical protein
MNFKRVSALTVLLATHLPCPGQRTNNQAGLTKAGPEQNHGTARSGRNQFEDALKRDIVH